MKKKKKKRGRGEEDRDAAFTHTPHFGLFSLLLTAFALLSMVFSAEVSAAFSFSLLSRGTCPRDCSEKEREKRRTFVDHADL